VIAWRHGLLTYLIFFCAAGGYTNQRGENRAWLIHILSLPCISTSTLPGTAYARRMSADCCASGVTTGAASGFSTYAHEMSHRRQPGPVAGLSLGAELAGLHDRPHGRSREGERCSVPDPHPFRLYIQLGFGQRGAAALC
jgi:hypothetical protein